jgi:hypothetical protein
MNLEYYQKFFKLVNTSAFCEEYGITYDHLRRVLKGERPFTAKLEKELSEAIVKFKLDI